MANSTSNKTIVGEFLGAVMLGDIDTLYEVANADYIQHNPFIPTGLDSFIELLPILKQNRTSAENIRMFEDGNFVFMHNIWKNAKPFGADMMVAFDIIRVDKHGKVAEHWDAMTVQAQGTASGRTQTDGPAEATDLEKTDANKATAKQLVEELLVNKNSSKVTNYINLDNYHQHNIDTNDGVLGMEEYEYTKVHAVLGEGNFVLTISEGNWNGKPQVFYNLFRFEAGMAVEHWDVIQEIPSSGTANDNGMFGF